VKRKIAAILAADIVGYSRLVGDDEEDTLRRLAGYRAVFSDFVTRFGGRIFNTAGDAILAEFPSAVDAVRCAVDTQESLRTRNLAYPPSRQMYFRIGITIGDVVEREGDLLGEGVNIASRLEGIAPVGGICISRAVYESVTNKMALKFADLGQQQLKNIPDRIHAYAVALDQGGTSRNGLTHITLSVRQVGATLAVLMIAALGTAAYFMSRSGTPAQSSSELVHIEPQSDARKQGTAADGDRGSDSKSREAPAPAESAKPGSKADASPHADAPTTPPVAVDDGSGEAEYCLKYLPGIGASVRVPCETTTTAEKSEDVQAPEHACDRLAANPSDPNHVTQGVAFYSIQQTEAVTACRDAVERYPQTRRFKYQLGRALQRNGSYSEAFQLFRPLVEAGYVIALNNLGKMYENGLGVAKDEAEAVRLYRQAAEKGNAFAMYDLGAMYERGAGVTKNETEAVRLYRQAAEKGNIYAINNLGAMYASGRGVAKNEAEAVRLYRQAAEKGNADAINNLGTMYASGRGVAKDEAEAVRLYRQAAEKGNTLAINNLGRMYASGRGVAKGKEETDAGTKTVGTEPHADQAKATEQAKPKDAIQIFEQSNVLGNTISISPNVDRLTCKDNCISNSKCTAAVFYVEKPGMYKGRKNTFPSKCVLYEGSITVVRGEATVYEFH